MNTKPIGGEFWYDNSLISQNKNYVDTYFLNGGRSSLACICRYLKSKNIYKVLLPNYLCPTILDVFDDEKVKYIFYEINEDFSINIESIKEKINLFNSIMFISYFGLSLKKEEREYLISLKNMGKIVIEDKVQSLSDDFIGDIAFNSFRKFMPISGSVLQTNIDLEDIVKGLGFDLSYETQIKKARIQKKEFILYNKGIESDYLESFRLAEKLYYKQYSMGSRLERELAENIDFKKIGTIRNNNYKYLQRLLLDIRGVRVIFESIDEKIPLGLPIYIDNDRRDFLVKRLRDRQIYLPVHWDLRNEDRIDSTEAQLISSKVLTLIIDQRYGKRDMHRLAMEIKKIIG